VDRNIDDDRAAAYRVAALHHVFEIREVRLDPVALPAVRLGRHDEVDRRQHAVVAPLVDLRHDDLEALVNDGVDADVHDEHTEIEIRRVGEGAAEEPPAAVPGEHEGMQAWVGDLRADAETEPATHGGAVVRRPELDV